MAEAQHEVNPKEVRHQQHAYVAGGRVGGTGPTRSQIVDERSTTLGSRCNASQLVSALRILYSQLRWGLDAPVLKLAWLWCLRSCVAVRRLILSWFHRRAARAAERKQAADDVVASLCKADGVDVINIMCANVGESLAQVLKLKALLRHGNWQGFDLADMFSTLTFGDQTRFIIHYTAGLVVELALLDKPSDHVSPGMVYLSLLYVLVDDYFDTPPSSELEREEREGVKVKIANLLRGEDVGEEREGVRLEASAQKKIRQIFELITLFRNKYPEVAKDQVLKLLHANTHPHMKLVFEGASSASTGATSFEKKFKLLTENERAAITAASANKASLNMAAIRAILQKDHDIDQLDVRVKELIDSSGPPGQTLNDLLTPEQDIREENATPAADAYLRGKMAEFVAMECQKIDKIIHNSAEVLSSDKHTKFRAQMEMIKNLIVAISMRGTSWSQAERREVTRAGVLGQLCAHLGAHGDPAAMVIHDLVTTAFHKARHAKSITEAINLVVDKVPWTTIRMMIQLRAAVAGS